MPKVAYHIHIDAEEISPQFEEYARTLGFWQADFLHEPEHESWEPKRSLTYMTNESQDFKRAFDLARDYAVKNPSQFVGYIEGEFIASDVDIEHKPFDPSVKLPFKVHRTSIESGSFREDEIHATFLQEQSDTRLQEALMAMGLHPCYLLKKEGRAVVLTVQGSRKQIDELLPALTSYLQIAGGGVRCSIKEERIADWWTSSPDVRLHPVIDHIEWL